MITNQIPENIIKLIEEIIIKPTGGLNKIYAVINDYLEKEQIEDKKHAFDLKLSVNDLRPNFNVLKEKPIRTIGIDFPLLLSKDKNRKVLFICAMDPLRKETPEEKTSKIIEPWVPFGIIDNPNNKHIKKKQNLLFFHILLNYFDLYVTDIYKIYYRIGKSCSNKDKDFKSLKIKNESLTIHDKILKAELNEIKPDFILTLGNSSRDTAKKIFNINVKPKWSEKVECTTYSDEKNKEIQIITVPHISNSANGPKKAILDNPTYKNIHGKTPIERFANIITHVIKQLP